jgi:hypothetical protein
VLIGQHYIKDYHNIGRFETAAKRQAETLFGDKIRFSPKWNLENTQWRETL